MHKILIVDDESEIVKLLKLYLERDSMSVSEAANGEEAYNLLSSNPFDLAIIDIMMPKMNGFELVKKLRETNHIPIIFLSAKSQTSDKIFGLEIGEDDYITKPFDAMEVVARVNAILRRFSEMRNGSPMGKTIKVRNLTLDLETCQIYKDEQCINLTAVELKLLKTFMASPGRVFTKEQLYEVGWSEPFLVDDNTIRVAISKLRDKVGEENIKTIRGLGYRLEK